eukprot:m.286930 g.286930  ORF g.286930 m.286930 type:complete len:523 (+) comp11670_c0_seq1:262-1830(+)
MVRFWTAAQPISGCYEGRQGSLMCALQRRPDVAPAGLSVLQGRRQEAPLARPLHTRPRSSGASQCNREATEDSLQRLLHTQHRRIQGAFGQEIKRGAVSALEHKQSAGAAPISTQQPPRTAGLRPAAHLQLQPAPQSAAAADAQRAARVARLAVWPSISPAVTAPARPRPPLLPAMQALVMADGSIDASSITLDHDTVYAVSPGTVLSSALIAQPSGSCCPVAMRTILPGATADVNEHLRTEARILERLVHDHAMVFHGAVYARDTRAFEGYLLERPHCRLLDVFSAPPAAPVAALAPPAPSSPVPDVSESALLPAKSPTSGCFSTLQLIGFLRDIHSALTLCASTPYLRARPVFSDDSFFLCDSPRGLCIKFCWAQIVTSVGHEGIWTDPDVLCSLGEPQDDDDDARLPGDENGDLLDSDSEDNDAAGSADAALVFSWACFAYFLLHRQIPFPRRGAMEFALVSNICNGQRPAIAKHARDFASLLQECWHPNPTRRPDLATLGARLASMHNKEVKHEGGAK